MWWTPILNTISPLPTTTTTTTTGLQFLIHTDLYLWTYSELWGSELAEPRNLWSPHRSSYPCDEHLSWILLPPYPPPPPPPPQLLPAFSSWYTQTCIYELTLDFEGVNLQNRGVCGVLTVVVSYPCDEHPSWILLPAYPPPPPPQLLPAFNAWYTQTCICELTLDFEGVDLQNRGVCGVFTGVVTHVMNTHLTEEQGAIIQHLRQKEQTPKWQRHFIEDSGKFPLRLAAKTSVTMVLRCNCW